VKKAQQHLFPLRKNKRFGMGPQILKKFYNCTNCSACGYGTLTCSPDVLPVPDLLFSTLYRQQER
jgi:hypothetical protein